MARQQHITAVVLVLVLLCALGGAQTHVVVKPEPVRYCTQKLLDDTTNSLVRDWERQAGGRRLTFGTDNYIEPDGRLHDPATPKLGCSAFAAAVLCQLVFPGGEPPEGAAPKGESQNWKLRNLKGRKRVGPGFEYAHQWFGAEIASQFGLEAWRSMSVTEFIQAARAKNIPAGVYFFDLRDETARKAAYYRMNKSGRRVPTTLASRGRGHVGFVCATSEAVTCRHWSGMSGSDSKGGLYSGGIVDYLTRSHYGSKAAAARTSEITLYRIPLRPLLRAKDTLSLRPDRLLRGAEVGSIKAGALLTVYPPPDAADLSGCAYVRYLRDGEDLFGYVSTDGNKVECQPGSGE